MVARQFKTGMKFGSEKGKVQNPTRIPPQTTTADWKSVGVGRIHFLRQIVLPYRAQISFQDFRQKMFKLCTIKTTIV